MMFFREFYLQAFRDCQPGHYLYLRFVIDSVYHQNSRGEFERWSEHMETCKVCLSSNR